MSLSVRERAESLATFRFIEVSLMETLARWVPTTPEMEVKLLFGQHLWYAAQHADALGRRTFELRAPAHYTLRPVEDYAVFLEELASMGGTRERLAGIYRALVPGLETRYRRYLEATDALMDEPSVRIVEGILHDYHRMKRDYESLCSALPDLASIDRASPEALALRESQRRDIVRADVRASSPRPSP
jgi:hypothetical protein